MHELAAFAGPLHCAIAWSGGLDSTVLLHALLQQRGGARGALRLRALHVDHALQPAAADFRRFCQRRARQWQLPLTVLRATVVPVRGGSIEEAARDARRMALQASLRPGEVLLTAQHADDQLESLLLALLRGAGPKGLAGMAAAGAFGDSRVLRPLLEWDRAAILAYAAAAALDWVEDPTNAELRFDRNYLRARVLPAVRARWPAAGRTAVRSARHSAAAAVAVERAALRDLDMAADGAGVDIAVLRCLSGARRAATLRVWIVRAGARPPNERHLREIEAMMAARVDAHPELRLPDCRVQRAGTRLVVQV